MDDLRGETFSPFADLAYNPVDSNLFQTKFYNVIKDTHGGIKVGGYPWCAVSNPLTVNKAHENMCNTAPNEVHP